MADPGRPDHRISDLPLEVLMMIMQLCPGSTLKILRLANTSFARMAEPLLWERLALVPNRDCLSSLTSLMKTSQMAQHVHEVTYDAQWNNLVDFLKRRPELQEVRTKSMDQLARAGVLARISLGQLGTSSSESENDTETKDEIELLTELLKCLPYVESLVVNEEYARRVLSTSEAPAYYQQACRDLGINIDDIGLYTNLLNCDRLSLAPLLVASANAKLTLKSIKCHKLSWHSFFSLPNEEDDETKRQGLEIFRNLAGSLESFAITFRTCVTRYHKSQLQSLGSILKSCTTLKSLRISFTDLGFPRRYSSPRVSSYLRSLLSHEGDRWPQRPILPQLESLRLENCACTEEELKHFLKIHSTTLRHLHLSDISLHYKLGPRGCWIRIVKFLKSKLNLKSMAFTKWLSNCGLQQWWVTEERVDATRLKSMVESYVVDKTYVDCPLDDVSLKPERKGVLPTNGKYVKGDWTWVMLYGDNKRTETVISGSNFFSAEPLEPIGHGIGSYSSNITSSRNSQHISGWQWDPSTSSSKITKVIPPSKPQLEGLKCTGWTIDSISKASEAYMQEFQHYPSYVNPFNPSIGAIPSDFMNYLTAANNSLPVGELGAIKEVFPFWYLTLPYQVYLSTVHGHRLLAQIYGPIIPQIHIAILPPSQKVRGLSTTTHYRQSVPILSIAGLLLTPQHLSLLKLNN